MTWARKPSVRVIGGIRVAQAIEGENALPRPLQKALRVARRMDQGARLSWSDSSLAVIGRNISEHRKHPETGDFLRQALDDATTLYAVLTAAVEGLGPPVGLPPVEPRPTADLGVAALHQG
jgi:hypothetical protein